MAKSLKFTIEVNGLELNERAQAEISKALNKTLMHKLGELDLTGSTPKEAPDSKAPICCCRFSANLLSCLLAGRGVLGARPWVGSISQSPTEEGER